MRTTREPGGESAIGQHPTTGRKYGYRSREQRLLLIGAFQRDGRGSGHERINCEKTRCVRIDLLTNFLK